VEPLDDEQNVDEEETPRATRFATPAPAAGRRVPGNLKKQQIRESEDQRVCLSGHGYVRQGLLTHTLRVYL
jgi:hypothetical protein